MPTIIPSADLRNRYAEIEKLAKETREPIYLTKNGRGSLVLMDIDAFESYQVDIAWKRYAEQALAEAEEHERSGAAVYTDVETAFEELLSEPFEHADAPGAQRGPGLAVHASA